MKNDTLLKTFLVLVTLILTNSLHTQVFWNEDFGTGCNQGTLAPSYINPNGAWTISNTGFNSPISSNDWYVSAREVGGQTPGTCGATACSSNNNTLHLGSRGSLLTGNDIEAEYSEDDFSFSFFGITFDFQTITDKRAETPTIDCSGKSNIKLSFEYLEFGEGLGDNGEVWYYDGSTWGLLNDLVKTSTTGCTNGSWSSFDIFLPSTADNNPNVKIGFRWYNDISNPGFTYRSFAIDNIKLEVPLNPIVQFAIQDHVSQEFDTGYNIMVEIINPDPINSTTVDIYLNGLDPNSRLNSWSTTTITFPAGSSTAIPVFVGINNNTNCDDHESFEFRFQNLTGAGSPILGSKTSFKLGIEDDDIRKRLSYQEDFETGGSILSSWRSSNSDWLLNTFSPISGFFDMSYNASLSGAANRDYLQSRNVIRYSTDKIQGIKARWRMNIFYPVNPSVSDFLEITLTNKQTGGTDNGYRLIIKDSGTAAGDVLVLSRIDNGILQASPFSGTNPMIFGVDLGSWNSTNSVGIEVFKDESGNWGISMDTDGDGVFNNLIPMPLTTSFPNSGGYDETYSFTGQMAFGVTHNTVSTGILKVDDIDVRIAGCPEIFYSQASGVFDAPIWDKTPSGVPSLVKPNQFSTFEIQTGHSVDLTNETFLENLNIQTAAELNMSAASSKMSVFGNFNVDGTFDPTNGKVLFIGHDPQTISGISGIEIPFYKLIINNDSPGSITADQDLVIGKFLHNKNGILDMDGNIIHLTSSLSNGTAGIYTIDFSQGDIINANVKLDRYIAGDSGADPYPGGWVALGTPINGQTMGDWNSTLLTTGFPGSDYPNYTNTDGTPFINIIKWNETTSSYDGVSGLGESISTEDGYFVYMDVNAQNTSMTGSFNKGQFFQFLQYSGIGSGWNLITNPYPCAIDWDDLYLSSANVSPVISVYDSDSDTYLTYNAVTGTGSASPIIASSQSFWVRALSSSAMLDYSEKVKSKPGSYVFEREFEVSSNLNISLSNSYKTDFTYVGVNENATPNYDSEVDGAKFGIPLPGYDIMSISTLSEDEVELSYNYYNNLMNEIEIPIKINVSSAGEYTFEINYNEEFPTSSCLLLHDLVTDEYIPVNENFTYTFNTEIFNGIRFVLTVGATITIEYSDITCYNASNGNISAFVNSEEPTTYIWFNENNEVIAQHNNITEPSLIENLELGNYTVEVTSENSICNTRSELIYIDEPNQENFNFSTLESNCSENELGTLIFDEQNNGIAYWYQVYKNNQQIESNTLIGYSELNLEGYEYTIHVQTNCSSLVYDVDLRDQNIPQIQITNPISNIMFENGSAQLFLNVQTENVTYVKWFVNQELVSEEEMLDFSFDQEGIYEVTVIGINESGFCYDEKSLSVTVSSIVSIENNEEINDVSVFANGDVLEIYSENILTSGNVLVINALGQIIIDHTMFDKQGLITEDISALSNGVYIVRVLNENRIIHSSKIIR